MSIDDKILTLISCLIVLTALTFGFMNYTSKGDEDQQTLE